MAHIPGRLQNLEYGVGTSTTASVGKVHGGNWKGGANKDYDFAIGGGPVEKLGVIDASGSATFWPTEVGIMAAAKRTGYTSTTLSSLTMQGGNNREAFKHESVYVNTLKLSCAMEGKLTAALDWMAVTPSGITVPAWKAYNTGAVFHWFQGVCTVGGGSYGMQSFEATISNNLTPLSDMDGGSAGSLRHPAELGIGNETVEFSCVLALPPGTNNLAETWDDLPDDSVTASLAFTSATPTTLTLALANLTLNEFDYAFTDSNNYMYYNCKYIGKPNTSNTWTLS